MPHPMGTQHPRQLFLVTHTVGAEKVDIKDLCHTKHHCGDSNLNYFPSLITTIEKCLNKQQNTMGHNTCHNGTT